MNRRKITVSGTQQQQQHLQQQQLWKNSEIGKIEIVHEKVKPLINTQLKKSVNKSRKIWKRKSVHKKQKPHKNICEEDRKKE